MLEQPGKKIKTLANILLCIYVVLGILAGILLAGSHDMYVSELSAHGVTVPETSMLSTIIIILICALIGTANGWINSILLSAYGSITDDLSFMCEEVEAIRKLTGYLAGRAGSAEPTDAPTWQR